MNTLILLTLLSSAPSTTNTSARLVGADLDEMRTALTHVDQRISAIEAEPRVSVLKGFGIGLAVAAVTYPSVVVLGALTFGLFGFMFAGPQGFVAAFTTLVTSFFGIVPLWGWVLMGVVLVGGLAMIVADGVIDAPRRAELSRLKQERVALNRAINQAPIPVNEPLTTVFTF